MSQKSSVVSRKVRERAGGGEQVHDRRLVCGGGGDGDA
jgi:hypothetical protein